MNTKHLKGWIKHSDFILLDILCLQLCFALAYWPIHGFGNPYRTEAYQYQAIILFMSQLIVTMFGRNYSGILRRKKFDEAIAVYKYISLIIVLSLVYLFMVRRSLTASRLQFGLISLIFLFVDILARQLNKYRIFKRGKSDRHRRRIVLFTSGKLVKNALEKLNYKDMYRDYEITSAVLFDGAISNRESLEQQFGIPVISGSDAVVEQISHGWVDEVFILQPDDMFFPSELMDQLMEMGITINYSMAALNDDRWPITDMRKLGRYKVLTSSIRFASAGDLLIKRATDVIGGLVGCVLTGILFLFVAPAIYIKSPGPIFFAQERVGRNGKFFRIYKFRSMYMDAEERKAELMARNKIKDGMMFKMEDDPRIIGSEKKDKNGKPAGIGNFIRNTSIDEFPQFLNVLKGDMSLVGTRPPTVDEWKKYDLSHRARMSIKPGITGLWQVSGRSSITDFEEVVRLDREYIEDWSLWLDLKILLQTIIVVFKRKGAA